MPWMMKAKLQSPDTNFSRNWFHGLQWVQLESVFLLERQSVPRLWQVGLSQNECIHDLQTHSDPMSYHHKDHSPILWDKFQGKYIKYLLTYIDHNFHNPRSEPYRVCRRVNILR